MAPSPVADLQGQTALCSQAVLEDELAESVLDVKGKEGVCSMGLLSFRLSEILLQGGWSMSPTARAAPGAGSRAGCPRQALFHHRAPRPGLKSPAGSMDSRSLVSQGKPSTLQP